MTEGAREEYAQALRPRYRLATKAERGQMLDEYCRVTGCHRKAAIRALRRMPATGRRRAGRPRRYGRELEPILEQLWIASDGLSGKLLVPILPVLLTALERHHGVLVTPAVRRALTSASAATLDRLLRPARRRRARQPRRVAPAASSVRGQVPLRTWGEWTDVRPGALQGDLVLHCGEMTDGFFLTTLVAVDVATSWIELEAVWGTGHRRVGTGIHRIRERLPFALRAWHSDNGGEFPPGETAEKGYPPAPLGGHYVDYPLAFEPSSRRGQPVQTQQPGPAQTRVGRSKVRESIASRPSRQRDRIRLTATDAPNDGRRDETLAGK